MHIKSESHIFSGVTGGSYYFTQIMASHIKSPLGFVDEPALPHKWR